jgi:hypothetical protein
LRYDTLRVEVVVVERRRNHALWIGPLVTFVGGVSYFTFFARFPALRDFPWVNGPIVLVGVGLTALGLWCALARPDIYRGRVLGSLGLGFSLIVGGLFFAYVFYLSYLLPAPTAVSDSLERAPEITLTAHDGRAVSLVDLRGQKAVIVFYRGYW